MNTYIVYVQSFTVKAKCHNEAIRKGKAKLKAGYGKIEDTEFCQDFEPIPTSDDLRKIKNI